MKNFWEELKSLEAGSLERREFIKKNYYANYSKIGVRLQYINELVQAREYELAKQLCVGVDINEKNKSWALPWFNKICDEIKENIISSGVASKKYLTKDKPDFLCIGAQKAGTSWLYANLNRNGNIWMPPIKELHYFDHLFCPANRKWTTWHIQKSAKIILEKKQDYKSNINNDYINYIEKISNGTLFCEEWYKDIFNYYADPSCVYGDITPEYSTIPEDGIRYIKKYLNSPKIIYIIRDPFLRVISQVKMNALRQQFPLDADENKWKTLLSEQSLQSRGDYKKFIPLWNKTFPESSILYMPFGLIAQDSTKFIQTVEDFLGVGHIDESEIIREKVWGSKEYIIPESILDYLYALIFEQYDFLKQNFTKEFIELI